MNDSGGYSCTLRSTEREEESDPVNIDIYGWEKFEVFLVWITHVYCIEINQNLKLKSITIYCHYLMNIFVFIDRHSIDQVMIDNSDGENTLVGRLGHSVKWMLNYDVYPDLPETIDWY